jgi:hypothetical protein
VNFIFQEVARLAKLDYEEQTSKDKELHDQIAAERTEAKYQKHYDACMEVVGDMVNFTCKVAEYRELTEEYVSKIFCLKRFNFCYQESDINTGPAEIFGPLTSIDWSFHGLRPRQANVLSTSAPQSCGMTCLCNFGQWTACKFLNVPSKLTFTN